MNTTKSSKVFINEPLEILKSARDQVLRPENSPQQKQEVEPPQSSESTQKEEDYKKQRVEQDGKQLEVLESELKDIRRQKLFNDLMQRIQSGEDVPLEEFSELSYEQKDVLKAQVEVTKQQKVNIKNSNNKNLIEPTAKKGRRFMGLNRKQAAEEQQTRVEKRLSPSG